MKLEHTGRTPAPRAMKRLLVVSLALAFSILFPVAAPAKPVPDTLGTGVHDVAAGRISVPGSGISAPSRVAPSQPGRIHDDRQRLLRSDGRGSVLVRLTLDGSQPLPAVVNAAAALPGASIVASTDQHASGVIEGFVPGNQLLAAARIPGVRSIVPAGLAFKKVGATTTHGVQMHRINRLPAGSNGAGITVGVLSDSYDTSDEEIRAADDVASGDLPGAGNPAGNPQPILVLEDYPEGSDEGRAMLQIVHDLAPKARLGFATAFSGEISFANNIRALAGFPQAPKAERGFRANVIVDDVGYYGAPFFQDGIVARAVDEVAAAGVAYFSSAGNTPGSQSYDAEVQLVPGTAASRRGTNLDFTEVDPEWYAGGFHNFAGRRGLDVAQTITLLGSGVLVFQWNEPYDLTPELGATIASGAGTVSESDPGPSFTFRGVAGQPVQIHVDADPVAGTPLGDAVFTVFDPNGEFVVFQDTGTVPESTIFVPEMTGAYTVVVEGYDGSTGDFVYRVREADAEMVSSDFNLLFFDADGAFITAFAENNLATNRPVELSALGGSGNVQLVIARANTPSRRAKTATRLRYVCDALAPQEYFQYLSPVTWGHAVARGAIGVGAYANLPPSIPEYFTSPGPATIYFDSRSRALRRPDMREKPDISAMDGANTTFFGSDSDADGFPNFYGTSASAPHAAAIGALMLQAAGGPGKLSPRRMRDVLQDSAFPHDLDPYRATAATKSWFGGLSWTALSDDTGVVRDANVFRIENTGRLKIAQLTIDLAGANTTQSPRGLVFDERAAAGMPLTVGTSRGLTAGQIQSTFNVPAEAPGRTGQWKRLSFSFVKGSFDRGDFFSFGTDRDEAATAVGGNSADLLGANFDLESGERTFGGATFTGQYETGEPFLGVFVNRIGAGYTPLDGYGFINGERAVRAVRKK